jgi:hypothetical protein
MLELVLFLLLLNVLDKLGLILLSQDLNKYLTKRQVIILK